MGVWPEYGTLSWFFNHVVFFVLRQNFSKAKISNLHPLLALHKDVSCCQVSVDIPLAWQVFHSLSVHTIEKKEKKKVQF